MRPRGGEEDAYGFSHLARVLRAARMAWRERGAHTGLMLALTPALHKEFHGQSFVSTLTTDERGASEVQTPREVAQAYLDFLYSAEAQAMFARHHFRPRQADRATPGQFASVNLFTVDEVFGNWRAAQARHFDDGGIFDSISQAKP